MSPSNQDNNNKYTQLIVSFKWMGWWPLVIWKHLIKRRWWHQYVCEAKSYPSSFYVNDEAVEFAWMKFKLFARRGKFPNSFFIYLRNASKRNSINKMYIALLTPSLNHVFHPTYRLSYVIYTRRNRHLPLRSSSAIFNDFQNDVFCEKKMYSTKDEWS